MEKIKIEFYRKNVYGQTLEYVKDSGQSKIIRQLTGQKTINGIVRELLRDLTGGMIEFVEVVAPLN